MATTAASTSSNKSTLSTDSPPFNPNALIRGGEQSNSPPGGSLSPFRNRSTSSTSNGSTASPSSTSRVNNHANANADTNAIANANANHQDLHPNSNATAIFTFEDPTTGKTMVIRNVWAENVEEEMRLIREVVETFPYVAMDTEFPGVVAKPITEAYTADYHYRSLKVNVDLLRIIQLGLTFADAQGNFCLQIWQFNFHFDMQQDMFAQDSIDLLVHCGISFPDHARRGIDPLLFGELLMVSGLVLDDRVKWVSFHSAYDFAYLLKILTTQELPQDEKSFFELLKIYFPTIYDIKYMCSLLDGHFFAGGLQRLADDLKCQRLGAEHQAGSDSLLTMSTYFALVKAKFNYPANGTLVDDRRYANELFGYGNNHTVRKGIRAAVAAGMDHSVSTGSLPGMD